MYKDEYERILRKIDEEPFSEIESKLAEWEAQLRPVTSILHEQNANFISPEEWEYAVSDLRRELNDARMRLKEKIGSDLQISFKHMDLHEKCPSNQP
jgi:hypothetical protein